MLTYEGMLTYADVCLREQEADALAAQKRLENERLREEMNRDMLLMEAKLKQLKAKKDEEKPLTIKQDAKGIVFVQGATIQDCATLEDLIRFQQYGDGQRHVAATAMNAVSSRMIWSAGAQISVPFSFNCCSL